MVEQILKRSFIVFMLLTTCQGGSAQTTDASAPPQLGDTVIGSAAPPFEVFCDFRCPFCASFFKTLFAGANYEEKALVFGFNHYPFHGGSETLARFYEAVVVNYPSERDGLIESLYRFRSKSNPDNVERLFRALNIIHGLDPQRIKRDMAARDVRFRISESKRAAVDRGVSGTPTIFYLGVALTLAEPEELARFILEKSPKKNMEARAPGVDECQSCENPRSPK